MLRYPAGQTANGPQMLITPTSNSAHTDQKNDGEPVIEAGKTSRYHCFTCAHRTLGRGRSAFSRVVPVAAYGLYAIDTALHSPSLRQLSGGPRSRSVPPAQTSLLAPQRRTVGPTKDSPSLSIEPHFRTLSHRTPPPAPHPPH